jgi:hypothetical protein
MKTLQYHFAKKFGIQTGPKEEPLFADLKTASVVLLKK